jgi:AraC-like DNA-binding protein
MSEISYVTQAGIFFSCTEKKQLVLEHIIPEHVLTHVYAGKITVTTADKTYSLSAGQTALFSRNQLAKFKKEPDGETPCKAATIFFTRSFLQQYYAGLPLQKRQPDKVNVLQLAHHPLLDNLFQSISVYSNLNETFISDELALLKVTEAITVIRMLDKNTDSLLSDFSDPHKIDLEAFMQQNFMFNISIQRFAYLTGRSLATFKRDFQKTFATSPQKWLTEKRLGQAHFLIAEKNHRPSQAYIEAGFESFSHFTYAFKKFFGYNPSSILSRQTNNI